MAFSLCQSDAFPLQSDRSYWSSYWALSVVTWTLPRSGWDIKRNRPFRCQDRTSRVRIPCRPGLLQHFRRRDYDPALTRYVVPPPSMFPSADRLIVAPTMLRTRAKRKRSTGVPPRANHEDGCSSIEKDDIDARYALWPSQPAEESRLYRASPAFTSASTAIYSLVPAAMSAP